MRTPCVYMLASRPRGTLYVGVTRNLPARVWQHRNDVVPGFTSQYGVHTLVWYEVHACMLAAIAREKQLKSGSRSRKLALIEAMNPRWMDLFDSVG